MARRSARERRCSPGLDRQGGVDGRGLLHLELALVFPHYKKKTHPWHFGPNEFFFCHTYDTSMTIIVTKPGIIIDVVGSYFYDKKS